MRSIFIFLLFFSAAVTYGQSYNKLPVISKVTATWCPNCGTWGWDYMDALKNEFSDGSAVLLGVHHSGLLENEVSDWFSKNLKNSYQPQFFVYNEMLDVSSFNWPQKVETMRQLSDQYAAQQGASAFGFEHAYVDGNNIVAAVNFQPLKKQGVDYYFGIYIFENNVVEYQSQRGQDAVHPFVLRDVMADNYWGELYNEESRLEKSFSLDGYDWNSDDIGLLAIMWERSGNDYIMDNAAVIYNIGLLSSSEEISERSTFEIINRGETWVVRDHSGHPCRINLLNSEGRVMESFHFTDETIIDTGTYASGVYIVLLNNKYGSHREKIIIAR